MGIAGVHACYYGLFVDTIWQHMTHYHQGKQFSLFTITTMTQGHHQEYGDRQGVYCLAVIALWGTHIDTHETRVRFQLRHGESYSTTHTSIWLTNRVTLVSQQQAVVSSGDYNCNTTRDGECCYIQTDAIVMSCALRLYTALDSGLLVNKNKMYSCQLAMADTTTHATKTNLAPKMKQAW